MEFLSALAAIIVIDLVLAGDNAIVIALAARKVPAHLQRRVILWGTFGAIAVRSALTLAVVWLLKIPGLMLGGGVLLLWIAYKLLEPEDGQPGHDTMGAMNFWGAMRTIVVADTVMGLDNVLAVAGAAHGNYVLVGLGLAISIPIVIWGSTLVLRFVERHPWTVYVGAGVLTFTAVKMMLGDPWLQTQVEIPTLASVAAYVVIVPGLLLAGYLRSRPDAMEGVRAADSSTSPAVQNLQSRSEGESKMRRILVPVDGTKTSEAAVRHVLNRFMADTSIEIHLLNVQTPLPSHATRLTPRREVTGWHREASGKALAASKELLDSHHVPYMAHAAVGEQASEIAAFARKLRCTQVVMGAGRHRALSRLFERPVADRLLDLTDIPVERVAGATASRLERLGVPAGLGAALALLLMASD